MGRAAFLLGAGVSLDAGMPSTSELTAKVLEGAVARGMESHYRLAPAQSPGPRNGSLDYIGLVMALVRELKTEVDAFYSGYPGRVANYEDIYYLAVQIADAMSGEYDNPALRLLIDRLAPILAGPVCQLADAAPGCRTPRSLHPRSGLLGSRYPHSWRLSPDSPSRRRRPRSSTRAQGP